MKNKKIIFGLGGIFLILLIMIISPSFILHSKKPLSYALYDKNGILLGARVASDEQWRFEKGDVPEKFEKAIINYEDKRFYNHFGVDLFAIGRAIKLNAKNNRVVSGGSTITMQTVRLLENHPKRTILQKIKEAYFAICLELRLSKKEILEFYSALAPFGGNVVGIEAASWRYFNRPPSELSWAECATLAVLPNQPSLVYPGANSNILLEKRNALLQKLFENNEIDEKTLILSLEEPLPQKPYPLPSFVPHYLEYLKKNCSKTQTKFYTTLDSAIQKNTQRILEKWAENFKRKGIENAAAIILDTKTKNVLAYCGNVDFENLESDTRNIDMVQAIRSSGSVLKPFLYMAMLDSGQLMKNQLVVDIPTRIGNYRPENNIPVYKGAIQASEALTRSLNIPAIRELREYGINAFLDYCKKCGFTTLNRSSDDYGLPLILGGGEVTLWETARAYADLTNTANGIKSRFPASRGSAWITLCTLADGYRPEDEANWQFYANSKRIAWKTGTSSGNRDTWCFGTTNEYTVGVWVGNAKGNGNPELKSVSTASPVLFNIFSSLPLTSFSEIPTEDLQEETVCSQSGYVAGENCTQTKQELKSVLAPKGKLCPYCTPISLTNDRKYQATMDDLLGEKAGIYDGTMPIIEKRFVLPANIEYWYKKTNLGYLSLPDFVPWHNFSDKKSNFSIMFPEQNANIIIPIELGGEKGALVMKCATRSLNTTLYWDLDGKYLGMTNSIHEMATSAAPGKHTLTVTDSNGEIHKRNFEVEE